jgi:hypothetical protein
MLQGLASAVASFSADVVETIAIKAFHWSNPDLV